MSVVVRPAGEADIDGVVDLLYGHMSKKITPKVWRRLLDYPWRPADADRGCVAVDGNRVVGYLGLVYADRPFNGRSERFCNICAWYLLKDYRGQGIGREIQAQSIADKEQTYTLVTATDGTDRAFRGGGFQVLDTERYILRRDGVRARRVDVLEGPDAVAPLLPPEERQILEDHRAYNVRHLFLSAGGQSCYLIVQARLQGDEVNYHQVMHLTDPEFIAAQGEAVADAVLEPGRAVLAIDRRFMPEPMPWETETLRRPRLYSAPRLRPHEVDHLYNEIVLLNLKLP